jgi:hypothetical protein
VAFEFIFRLYNFLSRANVDSRNLQNSRIELDKITNGVSKDRPALTSGLNRKHGADDGGADTAQGHSAPGHLGNPSVQGSLQAAGYEYELMPTDGMLVPITRVRTSHLLVERIN